MCSCSKTTKTRSWVDELKDAGVFADSLNYWIPNIIIEKPLSMLNGCRVNMSATISVIRRPCGK
jgi:hypothetical protein